MTGQPTGWPEIDFAAVIDLTQRLVRVPSVHDPDRERSEEPAAAVVAEVMREFGWEPVLEEVSPGRPNVHAVVDGGMPGPTLLFEGHTDVVSEQPEDAWTVPPFDAEIRDGRLYGRGSADMKSGVAAMLHATRAIEQAGPFPGRIKVAALCDEEGTMSGVKHFVAQGHAADCAAAIVCEPEAEEVCTSSKGSIRLRIDLRGRMAHGAMPDHGANPIPVLGRLLVWCAAHEAELRRRHGRHPTLGTTTVTATVIGGGDFTQHNLIPADGALGLDIRTVPGVDHAALVREITENVENYAYVGWVGGTVTVIDDRPATDTPENSPVIQAVMAGHRDVTGVNPTIGGVPGATDGTVLWRDAKLPVAVYGPGDKWIAHQADEYVEVDDVKRKAEVYARAAHHFFLLHGPEPTDTEDADAAEQQ
ncbi:MAG: ArgE/DapE family deacylase [Streptosporangiales bacterium]|nr:ArgE/DapE family deacylase [Streptosporangiales bacterium]